MKDASQSTIAVLESVVRILISADADARVVKDIRSIIAREKRALHPLSTKKLIASPQEQDEVSFIGAFLADIEDLLFKDLDRRTLERILIDRFNYSDRSVKSMGSKEKLLNSIRMSIKNERAHQTISNLTRG